MPARARRLADLVRDRSLGERAIDRRVEADLADPHPSTQERATGVHENLAEPCVELFRVTEVREVPPGRDEGVLGRVPGVGLAAEDRPCNSERSVDR